MLWQRFLMIKDFLQLCSQMMQRNSNKDVGRREILSLHGGIKQTWSEPYSPWHNQAEAGIQEQKKQVLRVLRHIWASKRLWDYAAIYVSEVRSCTAHPMYKLNGRTPYEIVAGDNPNITEWLEYDIYQPGWFYRPASLSIESWCATLGMAWSCIQSGSDTV